MSSTDNTNSFTVGQEGTPAAAATVTVNNAGSVTVAKQIPSQVISSISVVILLYNIYYRSNNNNC